MKDDTGEQDTISWITNIYLGFLVMTDNEKKPTWYTVFSKLHQLEEEFETRKSINQALFLRIGRP